MRVFAGQKNKYDPCDFVLWSWKLAKQCANSELHEQIKTKSSQVVSTLLNFTKQTQAQVFLFPRTQAQTPHFQACLPLYLQTCVCQQTETFHLIFAGKQAHVANHQR